MTQWMIEDGEMKVLPWIGKNSPEGPYEASREKEAREKEEEPVDPYDFMGA
jgi:hypothetical protein